MGRVHDDIRPSTVGHNGRKQRADDEFDTKCLESRSSPSSNVAQFAHVRRVPNGCPRTADEPWTNLCHAARRINLASTATAIKSNELPWTGNELYIPGAFSAANASRSQTQDDYTCSSNCLPCSRRAESRHANTSKYGSLSGPTRYWIHTMASDECHAQRYGRRTIPNVHWRRLTTAIRQHSDGASRTTKEIWTLTTTSFLSLLLSILLSLPAHIVVGSFGANLQLWPDLSRHTMHNPRRLVSFLYPVGYTLFWLSLSCFLPSPHLIHRGGSALQMVISGRKGLWVAFSV